MVGDFAQFINEWINDKIGEPCVLMQMKDVHVSYLSVSRRQIRYRIPSVYINGCGYNIIDANSLFSSP